MKLKQWIALFSFLLVFSITAYAGIEVYNDVVQAPDGHAIPSPTITVYTTGTTTLAAIYSNVTGSVKANPFTGDVSGRYSFYANDGHYDIKTSKTGYTTRTKSYILVGIPSLGTMATKTAADYSTTAEASALYAPLARKSVLVSLSTNQTLTNELETVLSWGTEINDNYDMHLPGFPTQLTVPAGASRVELRAHLRISGYAGMSAGAYIYKNEVLFAGIPEQWIQMPVGFAADLHLSLISAIIDVVPGDHFTVIAYQSNSGAQTQVVQAREETWFQMIVVN